MESREQLTYQPHFNNFNEVLDHKAELSDEELFLEFARLKFELGLSTMDLIKAAEICPDEALKKELKRAISIVALSDVPNVEQILKEEDIARLIELIQLVKSYKNTIKH